MSDYSGLSDFEIDRKITELIYIDLLSCKSFEWDEEKQVYWSEGRGISVLCYCANWFLAGKLMEENNISLQFRDKGEPMANSFDFYSVNESPKRAIAECYLMMMESNNE